MKKLFLFSLFFVLGFSHSSEQKIVMKFQSANVPHIENNRVLKERLESINLNTSLDQKGYIIVATRGTDFPKLTVSARWLLDNAIEFSFHDVGPGCSFTNKVRGAENFIDDLSQHLEKELKINKNEIVIEINS